MKNKQKYKSGYANYQIIPTKVQESWTEELGKASQWRWK